MKRHAILIVEESATQRTILKDMVSREGYEAVEATSGAEATELLRSREIDAVLVGWELPDVAGPALCHRWNNAGELALVPLLIMTSYSGAEHVRDCLDAGALDFISKPPNQLELFARLRLALRLRDLGIQLRESSLRDALTGLYNRRHVQAELARHFEAARRYGEVFAVGMTDIDFFKKINDTHGHTMGDTVLRQLADYFAGRMRKTDIVGRFGGEEFIVILHGTSLANGMTAMEGLRKGLADKRFGSDEVVVNVTFSAGVAEWTPETADIDALVRKADEGLYASKQGGRNRVTAVS
jgi:two-component system, cell cycle response regulator